MRDVIEAALYVVMAGALLYGAWRIGSAIDARMPPEDRDRMEWRHTR